MERDRCTDWRLWMGATLQSSHLRFSTLQVRQLPNTLSSLEERHVGQAARQARPFHSPMCLGFHIS